MKLIVTAMKYIITVTKLNVAVNEMTKQKPVTALLGFSSPEQYY